jgi:chemotaxis protein MotB
LFGSGDAMPSDMAFSIVDKVAKILKPFDNPVHVEGFTDNLPISTAQYPTNWELSTARAASMVRMMAMEGIDPRRLAAVGYGEFQPVADNATADGRGITSAGSANAQPDTALRRAGTQTALTPLTRPSAPGSVKSPPPGP